MSDGSARVKVRLVHLLDHPSIAGGEVLGASASIPGRLASSVSAIEWPVEGFVADGQVVLTTATGCNERMLEQLVREIVESGATAVLVRLDPSGPLAGVPVAAVAVAEEFACPLVEIPSDLRFADVTRVFTDLAVDAELRAELRTLDAFVEALVAGRALGEVAEALDQAIGRPVMLFDRSFRPVGHSTSVLDLIGARGVERCRRAAERLTAGDRIELERRWTAYRPRAIEATPELAIGSGLVVGACVREERVGYICALERALDHPLGGGHERALRYAALAFALELRRAAAVTETETRLRGEFFWEMAESAAEGDADAQTRATLLGCDLGQVYEVGLVAYPGPTEEAEEHLAVLERSLRGSAGGRVLIARRTGEILVLCMPGEPGLAALRERLGDDDGRIPPVNWGFATDPVELRRVKEGYQSARRALKIGYALDGVGAVGDGGTLGSFLMLAALGEDDHAIEVARDVLSTLVEYDLSTSRGIVATLEAFLAENGNISSAARRLHLDRHALRYRLRKIEEMTGRSLDSSADRFLLQLSLMLVRINAQDSACPH